MFAVITDIHGNYPALRAALQAIDESGVDRIFCLGDMIGIGPDSNEVLHMLFARNDISMITGNHDEAVLALLNGDEYPISHLHVRSHHEWIASRLEESLIQKLNTLPRAIKFRQEALDVLMIHYHINQEKSKEHISKDPFSSVVEPSLPNLVELFSDRQENLICFGHHHPSHYFANHDHTFLNPGSLGCYDKPAARFALVHIAEGQSRIELKEVKYDNTEFLKSYSKLEVPDRDFILKIFHGNQLR
ncbi:metallophosphoesterase family protein [Paenibacillus aurantius]|uniref:Metallophosphoesterase family protein n=1 Tax=Paenibacillus aurantius TaxID=2918900 RepID=A0AA96RDY2_9BACL|nr:metallophosphoesterase family protein [Paenibacillus aurantius]WNQ09613.1 metallophosphoesterase family protein [Paenibacillus aurantius]